MKEIDFIPEWYRADRKRKRRYVRQSTMMAIIFVVMVVWSFIVDRHVTEVNAQVQEIRSALAKGQNRVAQVMEIQGQIEQMQQKTELLDKLSGRTKMTAILAEVSYLMKDEVVLSDLILEQEDIESAKDTKSLAAAAVVQIGSPTESNEDAVVPEIPSRTVMTLNGIATEPADAAALISRMEQSMYFDGIALVFSRPKKVKEENVTEFKIRCYVADYQITE